MHVMVNSPPAARFLTQQLRLAHKIQNPHEIKVIFDLFFIFLLEVGDEVLDEGVDPIHDENPLGPGLGSLSDAIEIPIF